MKHPLESFFHVTVGSEAPNLGWPSLSQENKEMRVPVSSQIYPPPVSINAKLLPPLTDGQAIGIWGASMKGGLRIDNTILNPCETFIFTLR